MIPIGAIVGTAAKGLAWVWTFVSPFAGPVLRITAPWLAWLPPLATIKRGASVGLWVGILALGMLGGVKLHAWWGGDKLTQQQADSRTRVVVDKLSIAAERAAIEAERRALAEQRAELDARARWAEQVQVMQDQFERDMEADRARTEGDGAIAVSGDDVWLRAWQRRKY